MNKLIVYKITNTINGKLYFGITKVGIRKRWIQHVCNSKRKPYHLYRAMVKHGIQNFKIEIVKICKTENEMYNLEIELISTHKSNDSMFGYNNSTGGETSTKGSTRTLEQRAKISQYQKIRKRKPFSVETIEKMRLSALGRDTSKAVSASVKARKGLPAKNRLKVFYYNENGERIIFNSITDAAKSVNLNVSAIHNNLNNKTKTSGGKKWHYYKMN